MTTVQRDGAALGKNTKRSVRRRLPAEERRQQIVDGAVAFFAAAGIEGNTRDLANGWALLSRCCSTTSRRRTI